ncbi:hypothetical protein [Hymenobacter bucti]|uniref:Uncharacterized protein n=1 Tax=Hymenobacter bucti TaxID=1844114 RepID=A0ABW4QSN4_9BACT
MAKNQVTEADLREHYEHWQRLQVVHQAKQARYEPRVATASQDAGDFPGVVEHTSTQ